MDIRHRVQTAAAQVKELRQQLEVAEEILRIEERATQREINRLTGLPAAERLYGGPVG